MLLACLRFLRPRRPRRRPSSGPCTVTRLPSARPPAGQPSGWPEPEPAVPVGPDEDERRVRDWLHFHQFGRTDIPLTDPQQPHMSQETRKA